MSGLSGGQIPTGNQIQMAKSCEHVLLLVRVDFNVFISSDWFSDQCSARDPPPVLHQ